MNRSKQRGTAFESAVVEYLRGCPNMSTVERRAQRGTHDGGDLSGVYGPPTYHDARGDEWVCELKALRELDVAGAMDEAEKERSNVGARWCAAILKRRRKGVADAYVVMNLAQFARLLGDNDS